MPSRLFVFALLCAVFGTVFADVHSDFLREVNAIAKAEVSDGRTITADKTDSSIINTGSSHIASVSVPELSKAVASDPNYKQHFLAEISSMNGQEAHHQDDDSAHANALLKEQRDIVKEQQDLAQKEAHLVALKKLAASRERLSALKRDEAAYYAKAKAEAARVKAQIEHRKAIAVQHAVVKALFLASKEKEKVVSF